MKKAIIFMLVLVLTLSLMAGCRPGSPAESIATEASNKASEMMPDGNNGDATDGDGFIGEGNGNSNSSNGSSGSGSDSGTNGGPGNSSGGGSNGGSTGSANGGVDNGNGNGSRSSGFLPIHN